ncbi:MAG: hypothetical protein RJQ08_11555 [Salinisphaeraceae bacterium]
MAIADTGDALAAVLTHGGAAQDFALQIALPFASYLYEAAAGVFEIVAFLSLLITFVVWLVYPSWYILQWFGSLVGLLVLLAPMQFNYNDTRLWVASEAPDLASTYEGERAGNFNYPWSVVFVYTLLGIFENAAYDAVNAGISLVNSNSSGGVPLYSLGVINQQTANLTGSPELKKIIYQYNHACGRLAKEVAGLNNAQMQAVGLGNGLILGTDLDVEVNTQNQGFFGGLGGLPFVGSILAGVGAVGDDVTRDEYSGAEVAANHLSQLRPNSSEFGVFNTEGYLIPNTRYWEATEDRTRSPSGGADSYLSATATSANLLHPDPNRTPSRDELADRRFFPENCAEFYEIAQLAMQQRMEFRKAKKAANQSMFARALDGTSDSVMTLFGQNEVEASRAGDNRAFYQHQQAMMALKDAAMRERDFANDPSFENIDPSGGEEAGSLIGGWIKGGLWQLITWWKSLQLDYAVVTAMGIVALACAVMFLIAPAVLVMAVLPGRFTSILTLLKLVIFAKLTLFLMYVFLRLGALMSDIVSYASVATASTDAESLVAFMALSMVIEFAVIVSINLGSPFVAYQLVFGASPGLSSMRANSMGEAANRLGAVAALAATRLGVGAASANYRAGVSARVAEAKQAAPGNQGGQSGGVPQGLSNRPGPGLGGPPRR